MANLQVFLYRTFLWHLEAVARRGSGVTAPDIHYLLSLVVSKWNYTYHKDLRTQITLHCSDVVNNMNATYSNLALLDAFIRSRKDNTLQLVVKSLSLHNNFPINVTVSSLRPHTTRISGQCRTPWHLKGLHCVYVSEQNTQWNYSLSDNGAEYMPSWCISFFLCLGYL